MPTASRQSLPKPVLDTLVDTAFDAFEFSKRNAQRNTVVEQPVGNAVGDPDRADRVTFRVAVQVAVELAKRKPKRFAKRKPKRVA